MHMILQHLFVYLKSSQRLYSYISKMKGKSFCLETSNQFSGSEVFQNFCNSPQASTNSKTKRNLSFAFSFLDVHSQLRRYRS